MRDMHWSWEQLQATPRYVRRYCSDFLTLHAEARAEAADRAQREIERRRRG